MSKWERGLATINRMYRGYNLSISMFTGLDACMHGVAITDSEGDEVCKLWAKSIGKAKKMAKRYVKGLGSEPVGDVGPEALESLSPFFNKYIEATEAKDEQSNRLAQHLNNLDEPSNNPQVNHPEHYNDYPVEVIDMMERIFGPEKVLAFCELNAFKYRMRAGNKSDNVEQDFAKERWYLDKASEFKRSLSTPSTRNRIIDDFAQKIGYEQMKQSYNGKTSYGPCNIDIA